MAWSDLSEREKNLDRKITASVDYELFEKGILKYTDVYNLKNETIDRFMEITGATPNERDFIISRIKARLKAKGLLSRVDSQTNEFENILKKTTQAAVNNVKTNNSSLTQKRVSTIKQTESTDSTFTELMKMNDLADACEHILEQFKKSDNEFERKGRELGFNFWDMI